MSQFNTILQTTAAGSALTTAVEQFLENFAREIQVPDARYETAATSYKSVGNWFSREGSSLINLNPQVHSQGSFALGTVIKPLSDEDDYDVDMICSVEIDRSKLTQKQLKTLIHEELKKYAEAKGMSSPEQMRRCVRLNYADGSQFHLDATPASPDKTRKQFLLEKHNINNEWSDLSIVITDNESPLYNVLTYDWPHSNPLGYAKWFRSKMQTAFDARKKAIMLEEKRASISEIPDYRVRTPLQSAIQILKRHRDMTHQGETADKPISIIINTLAAHAYNQETSIAQALYRILNGMERFIQNRRGVFWVENPTDPLENFADKWEKHPERKDAFFEWLEKAKEDFYAISNMTDRQNIGERMAPVLGHRLVESAVNQKTQANANSILVGKWRSLSPSHKQPLIWPSFNNGTVSIKNAKYSRNGFRSKEFTSGTQALPLHCTLNFEAETNVSWPYKVYWQIVNNGSDAKRAGSLRGGFDEGVAEIGKLKRTETTLYTGTHTIECFIVKNRFCVAQSGPFVVNIR